MWGYHVFCFVIFYFMEYLVEMGPPLLGLIALVGLLFLWARVTSPVAYL